MISVVILDDNKPMADRIAHTIPWKELGCEVVAVEYDGLSGKKAIVQYLPDLIVTDVRMPNLSGLELIELTRKQIPDSKVIFISAYDEFEYAYRAIKLKADDYLIKPFTQAELLKAIRHAVDEIQTSGEQPPNGEKKFSHSTEQSSSTAKNAIDYCARHLSEHITLDDLARLFNISPNYLGKLIQQETGQKFSELSAQLRMDRAKELLRNGEYKMTEISEMVGYTNYLTFYKFFTKIEGVSPSEYLKKEAKDNEDQV